MEDREVDNIPMNKHPYRVQVVGANGEQITDFGGGDGSLPAGAATAANQATGNSSLSAIASNTTPPAAIADGLKLVTTAGTREALASSTVCKWVSITAKQTNTGVIVVGGTTVVAASGATRRGTPLSAGDSFSFQIDNLNDVNIDATVSGEGVTYTYTV